MAGLPDQMEMSNSAVMRLVAVRFGYQPQEMVLNDIDVELQSGTVTALIGPNAAGKSTLLRLMMGQYRPSHGRIELEGKQISEFAATRRAELISYVPQHSGLGFAYTVRQIIEMGGYVYGADGGEAVDYSLKLCGLCDVQDRVMAHLSGGQQQRVLLARAIVQSYKQGKVMLLDEPVSHMDLWHIHRSLLLLRHLAGKRGLAILVVLHDLNLAVRYADHVWLMANGRFTAVGPWRQVLRPEILQPVYQVRMRLVDHGGDDRPLFFVEHADDTLIDETLISGSQDRCGSG